MAITIEDLQARRAVLNIAGLGAYVFGEKTPAAKNLTIKVKRNRQLKAEESNALSLALENLGISFSQHVTSRLLITTADIRRVMSVFNIAGIGDLAFGNDSATAVNFRKKVSTHRSLTTDESEKVMLALESVGIWIEHREEVQQGR